LNARPSRPPQAPIRKPPCKLTPHSSPHSVIATSSNPRELNVVLVYENLSAIVWAAETLSGLFYDVPDEARQHLSPWSFAMLDSRERRARAAVAAARAHLIVIAASSEVKSLPPAVEKWLERCLARRCAARVAVAALLGFTNRPDRAESPGLRWVQHLAQKAGCEFFAPCAAKETLTTAPV